MGNMFSRAQPQAGDFGDNSDYDVDTEARGETGRANKRMNRAIKRAINRSALPPPMGGHKTAFDLVTLTDRRRGSGGFATTNKDNFPGSTPASKTNGSYKELLGAATKDTLKAVEAESRKWSRNPKATPTPNPFVTDPDQRRIAAGLMGIELSENQRHRAASKGFRAGIRAAMNVSDSEKNVAEKRATAMFEVFPQAAPKGIANNSGRTRKEKLKMSKRNTDHAKGGKRNTNSATGARAFLLDGKKGIARLRAQNAIEETVEYWSDSSDGEGSASHSGDEQQKKLRRRQYRKRLRSLSMNH